MTEALELLSLVLTLQALPPAVPPTQPLPRWWGRAAHALLLNLVRQYNPRLAEALHASPTSNPADRQSAEQADPDLAAIRPFTVSTLIGRIRGDQLDPQQPYTLRLTAFQPELAHILASAADSGALAPGQAIELDYLPFRIIAVNGLPPRPGAPRGGTPAASQDQPPPSPYAAAGNYADLAAPYLLAHQSPPRRLVLQFTSPTTFKSGGKHVPVPLPGLVFGSLLERWNAYAPIAFPAEVKRYAEECLAISQYRLSTRPIPMKSGGLRVGAVGEISYTSLNYDRYWMSVIATLARFALFSGVGAGTTMGLGQCRAPGGEELAVAGDG